MATATGKNSRGGIARAGKNKTSSASTKSNQNYATSLANGGSVTVKDGVKTYSDKPLQVRGRSGQSISGQDYSIDKGGSGFAPAGKVITAEALKPVEKINLPTPAPTDGLFGVTDGINASLAGMGGATYDTTSKQIVPPVSANPQEDKFQSLVQQYMGANSQAFNEMPSSTDRLKEQQKMLRPKENLVNSLQSQVNTIVANRDAEMLGLEGQGRGISESIIGGQQAQISREAAIRALPVQAQLAAAQDDLESARSYASQLFQAQSQDALAKYNYQKDLNASIFNFLNEKEKRTLAANEKANDRAFSVEQSNRDTLKTLSLQALEYGQGALAAEAMKLNPASPTFDQDYGDVMSRLRKPVAGTAKRDTQVVDGKLIDMQTGEVINNFANADNQQQEQLNETLTLARELLSDDTSGKSGAVGFGFQKFVPFGQSLGLQGDRTSFENKVNTLKANLTLDNLKLLKGPMSDKDLAFLQAIGSSLTTNMSEKSFNNEMTRIVNKLEEKVAPVSPYGTQVITAPDGLEIEIID